jgi:CBS domain-containing protein
MTILDKAKTTAGRAREQAAHGVEKGRTQLRQAQARVYFTRLLGKLGKAYYAEHRGQGGRAAVTDALTALDTHLAAHPQLLHERAERPARMARDIMHGGAECVDQTATLTLAAQKMRDLGVGSLPICGADDKLHGILTDRDIVIRCVAEGRDPAAVTAGDLAQGTVFWVDSNADLDTVVGEMEQHRIKRLPVIENHRLVGMISEADLARHLSEDRLAEFVEKVYATS